MIKTESSFTHRLSYVGGKNQVHEPKDDAGVGVDWNTGIANLLDKYFEKLFCASQPNWKEVIDCVLESIMDEQNAKLLKPVSTVEIKRALFQIHPDKSPGPDDISPAFFQKHWAIVGNNMLIWLSIFLRLVLY